MRALFQNTSSRALALLACLWTSGCTLLAPAPRLTEVCGDIDDLARVFERSIAILTERGYLTHFCKRAELFQQIAIITRFDNKTEILVDCSDLQRAWEKGFGGRSHCRVVWGQDWEEENIASKLEGVRLESQQRSFETGQQLSCALGRIELLNFSTPESGRPCHLLRVTWQDPQTRSEIDRVELPLELDPARFLAGESALFKQ